MSRTIILVLAVLTAITAPARASEGAGKYANKLNARAVEAYRAGQFRLAAQYFEESYALVPRASTAYHIALSYEKAEDYEAAQEHYEGCIKQHALSQCQNGAARIAKRLQGMVRLRIDISEWKMCNIEVLLNGKTVLTVSEETCRADRHITVPVKAGDTQYNLLVIGHEGQVMARKEFQVNSDTTIIIPLPTNR